MSTGRYQQTGIFSWGAGCRQAGASGNSYHNVNGARDIIIIVTHGHNCRQAGDPGSSCYSSCYHNVNSACDIFIIVTYGHNCRQACDPGNRYCNLGVKNLKYFRAGK
jgi:hypothetical protein